ncbi:helix-turn-helix transcriptional regulator [Legionella sp. CNM-4043-24]|uniref:helix-turn-helix transcriptional regulator n=1 Tax=Legionella sp. CNM-4043-24 TaxID=3421646 RepID=UPI00403B0AB7
MPIAAKSHPLTAFCKDVQEIIKPLNQIGIDYLSYTRVYANGARIYLSASAQILDDYLLYKKYLKVVNDMSPSVQPSNKIILWSTLPYQELVQEAKSMGAGHGFFVFKEKTNPDYCESLGFATSQYNESIINNYFSNIELIREFTANFHKEAGDLISKAEKHKITLPFNECQVDMADLQNLFLKFEVKNSPPKLTRRQMDCVKLLMQGMNAKMIAKELKLSPRTVEFYLEGLKARLECKNRVELIFKLGKYLQFIST